jgi:hypothetical protein
MYYSEQPAVGDVVTPRDGLTWSGRSIRTIPHVVTSVHDYRAQGHDEIVIVLVEEHVYRHFTGEGQTVPGGGPVIGAEDVSWAVAGESRKGAA